MNARIPALPALLAAVDNLFTVRRDDDSTDADSARAFDRLHLAREAARDAMRGETPTDQELVTDLCWHLEGHGDVAELDSKREDEIRALADWITARAAAKQIGMPAIVFSDEAAATWMESLDRMIGWNVTLTLIDGTQAEASIVGTERDPADGFPRIRVRSGHSMRGAGLHYFYRSDEFTHIEVH